MKKLILILVGILTLSCSKESKTKYSIHSEKVFLVITKTSTEDELMKIASEFKVKKNIKIDFSKTEFSENGKIENLDLQVDCNDGFKGNTQSSGLLLLTKNYGFFRDYSENPEVPFMVGEIQNLQ
ncbi:MAG: hypothetical protein ACPGSD_04915 [Flavobacteriales bacterium]